jgi:hypothetical protein
MGTQEATFSEFRLLILLTYHKKFNILCRMQGVKQMCAII